MQFKVLGSFEVVDGAQTVKLGGRKQRAALAVLLLSANRVVPPDRLIDNLWGEDPPRQALASLQAYISNLRRALEPDRGPREPPRLLRSQGGGYLLAVDVADVDAATFEQRTAQARTLLREGRPQAAREMLEASLALWRGPAFVDFADEPFARNAAARLEELRQAAVEERLEADLALGAHAAVVGELQQLVADEPLRERLWAHLVLALYRSGRQGDALAAYQQCRRTLADEIGLDPSPSLRRLEAQVLAQDPELDWAPSQAHPDRRARATADHSAAPRAFLTYRDEQGRAQMRLLEPADTPITVGRDAAAGLCLPWDIRISRHHADLECGAQEWAVADAGRSSNGSFVNDERVADRRALADGDRLRFGETVMTFRVSLPASAEETFLDG